MHKLRCLIVIMLSAYILTGCTTEGQPYTPEDSAVVTAWNELMQQPTGQKTTDEIIAEYAALPQPEDCLQAAHIWSLAVQHRNGYAQYALLSEPLREEKRLHYDAAGWVTGVSSPWIESFDIYAKRKSFTIDFLLNTSSGPFGSFRVKIKADALDGGCRITSIEIVEGESVPYIY